MKEESAGSGNLKVFVGKRSIGISRYGGESIRITTVAVVKGHMAGVSVRVKFGH